MKINEITKKYRKVKNISYRGFANVVNSKLINTDMSYSTIRRLETENYEPFGFLDLLFECIASYRNTENHWVAEWAAEIMGAMYPDLFFSGVIQINLNHKETIQP